MFKVIRGDTTIEGTLSTFDGGDGVLYFTLVGRIEVEARGISDGFIATIRKIGLTNLQNAVLDLNRETMKIDIPTKKPVMPPPDAQQAPQSAPQQAPAPAPETDRVKSDVGHKVMI